MSARFGSGQVVCVQAPAKLNLGLRVLGTLPNGYHGIETVFQTISWHDLLFACKANQTSIEVDGELDVSTEQNLVCRALGELELAVGRTLSTRFHLVKRVPVGAGLGGGSSDAAAALRLLEWLYGPGLPIAAVARRIGADVSFFLRGGRMLGTGIGDQLQPLAPRTETFVVSWPDVACSTSRVYALYHSTDGAVDGNDLVLAARRHQPQLAEFVLCLERVSGAFVDCRWRMTGTGSAHFCGPLEWHVANRLAVALVRSGLRSIPVTTIAGWGR